MTLALMGSSDGETEPIKVTHVRAGHRPLIPTSLEIIPAESKRNIGKSLGNPVVKRDLNWSFSMGSLLP